MEITILIFIFGLIVGSFLNVCIYRIPAEQSIVTPRSHCPKCNTLIAWYDNIPLLSYVILGAKCRHCEVHIPIRYFLVELLTGICFLIIQIVFHGPNFASITYTIVTACLIVITFIDFDHFIIPDSITYPGMVIGILSSIFLSYFPQNSQVLISEFSFFSFWSIKYAPVLNSLFGLIVGGGILLLIAVTAKAILKKDAMGGGDVKLLAFVGSFIGWKLVVLTLIFASFIGSVVGGLMLLQMKFKNKESSISGHYIPFGPYLALGTFIAILWGNPVIRWYLDTILGLAISSSGRGMP